MSVNSVYDIQFLANEALKCLLCHDAPCNKACPLSVSPADFIRSIRFENKSGAASYDTFLCESCPAPCEKACIHYESPVKIKDMAKCVPQNNLNRRDVDLSIEFCGVKCENPFFLSSSVVASNYEMCANALKMGWSGIVFKTIGFLIPKEVSPRFDATSKEGTPFVGFRNLEQIAEHSLEENLDYLRRLKLDFPSKVIVPSIMGQTEAEWTRLAELVTEAGADIIECNFSCPHMTADGLGSDVGQSPELVGRYTAAVRRGTHLPILAKMTPNIGNVQPAALAALQNGATGIAAINTIKSISSVSLNEMAAPPHISGKSAVSGYSGKAVKPIALRFIHDLAAMPEMERAPLSGMGGIETWKDAAEFIALGCDNIQITTAVMQYGYRIIDDLVSGLAHYMKSNNYRTVRELCGKALSNIVSPEQLDRDSLSFPHFDKSKCVGCGRCFISCRDAGHQAICFSDDRKPKLDGKKCVGCHLCLLVCPALAISPSKRIKKPSH